MGQVRALHVDAPHVHLVVLGAKAADDAAFGIDPRVVDLAVLVRRHAEELDPLSQVQAEDVGKLLTDENALRRRQSLGLFERGLLQREGAVRIFGTAYAASLAHVRFVGVVFDERLAELRRTLLRLEVDPDDLDEVDRGLERLLERPLALVGHDQRVPDQLRCRGRDLGVTLDDLEQTLDVGARGDLGSVFELDLVADVRRDQEVSEVAA